MKQHVLSSLYLALLIGIGGCSTPTANVRPVQPPNQRLAHAKLLADQGRYSAALIRCVDLARENPLLPGLPELQASIITRLNDMRQKAAAVRSSTTNKRMDIDVQGRKVLPATYGLQRPVKGENTPLKTMPGNMESSLRKRVTVHLDGVNLNEFILAIGASDNINIVADAMNNTSTMTIHAEDVPLFEILDYVSRNLGVEFYVGDNLIWATPGQEEEANKIPLETRMYRLRKGISGDELGSGSSPGGGDNGDGGGRGAGGRGGGASGAIARGLGAAGVGTGGNGQEAKINIVEAIERFIPEVEGSDVLFIRKGHLLIAKNTRRNLAAIETLIEQMDVCPPQILIEARFITTSVNDLRELGIDWILNSPVIASRRNVYRDGRVVRATETEIATGAEVGFAPFPTEAEGLNLTYQGLLSDPLFKAVLHALETSGKSRTLSVPRVTTVNNREADIRIGQDFRYFEEYDVQSVLAGSNQGGQAYTSQVVPVGSPTVEELGIMLKVTPSVGADLESITLSLSPKITEFVKYEFYEIGQRSGNNSNQNGNNTATNGSQNSLVRLPIFKTSEINTELICRSGDTVVMGGLITTTETREVRRVPLLSSLPLIGRLFRHEIVEEKKDNLLIFVTASILSDRGESLIPMLTTPIPRTLTPPGGG